MAKSKRSTNLLYFPFKIMKNQGKYALYHINRIMIPYKPFANHLTENKVIATPAELHGHVCGMLIVNFELKANEWIEIILEDYCFDSVDKNNLSTVLESLFEFAKEKLNSENFSFNLLLPSDEDELSSRLDALSSWCSNFLSGMAYAGFKSLGQLSEEANEFIQDLEKISKVETNYDGSQGEEADYYELVEYVRAGTMIVYGEFASQNNQKTTNSSSQTVN